LNLIEIDSPLEEAIAEFLPKLEDVLLEPIYFLEFSCPEISVDVELIYLIDGQSAEVGLGFIERFLSVGL
jgi:hypothetical protein